MRHINKIEIQGRVVADSETFDGQHKRTVFRVATNIPYKQNNEWRERTTYHPVTIWGKLMKISKGVTVNVRGEVSITKGISQVDGIEREYYGIKAFHHDVTVCSEPVTV
jgi:single-stranded DNA-binding protein